SAAQLTGVKFGSFWLADEPMRTLTFVGGSNAEMADDFPLRAMSYDEGGVGWVARNRKALVVDDVRQDTRVASPQCGERWRLRSFAASWVPAGDQPVAVLSLSHTEPVRFSPDTAEV